MRPENIKAIRPMHMKAIRPKHMETIRRKHMETIRPKHMETKMVLQKSASPMRKWLSTRHMLMLSLDISRRQLPLARLKKYEVRREEDGSFSRSVVLDDRAYKVN
ncbi:hypothetical protein Bbelb_035820 [Branchiostoma belcheri]|nr:hypothetical protein Bbelb_035820 [Branchiostoma belcheri]